MRRRSLARPPERHAPPAKAEVLDPDLANEVARRIGPLVSIQARSQVVAQVVSLVSEERFSGPLPHPRHFREYDEALPGSGDRLLKMVEEDLVHTRGLQAQELQADIDDMKEGRRLGFAALVILMLGAIICGVLGKDTIALALLGASVLGTINVLIKGRGKANDA